MARLRLASGLLRRPVFCVPLQPFSSSNQVPHALCPLQNPLLVSSQGMLAGGRRLANFALSPISIGKFLYSLRFSTFSSCEADESGSVPCEAEEAAELTECGFEMEKSAEAPKRWRPICLYFTQNRCLYMDNPEHLEKFAHSYPELLVDPALLDKASPQPFEHFLVLDLEGKIEILEFPVVLVNAKTLEVVDRFHRFVRPCKLEGLRLQTYIAGKYGRWGLESLWNDTAISFDETLKAFENWLEGHGLWDHEEGGKLTKAAFVTCGNWDIKTKIPEQCTTSGIPLPAYFSEWINLKDIYLNFYNLKATGMVAMLRGLNIKMQGSHHLGLDDSHNITRILQRMLCDGATLSITARRVLSRSTKRRLSQNVEFLFKNRV